MKLAIIGTHGTGKTSLAHAVMSALKEAGINAGMTQEQVRNCPIKIGTENEKNVKAELWIICRQIADEVEKSAAHDVVVCDRSVLDTLAYYTWMLERDSKLAESDVVADRAAHKLVDEWLSSYNHFFYVQRSESTLVPDGFRSTSPEWQREIDDIVLRLMREKGIAAVTIPLAPNHKRAEIVLNAIRMLPAKATA
ncbi:AAA family ATPase [Candidatus Micrarchaeota archaeon]|nr:AAA family ATPase [Candidatus Micrarchaeota archaeon]